MTNKYEDYYNFNDKIVKREEKDYLSHRGFMKELLEKFKNEKILESFETIMINITNIARCICTPKYGFFKGGITLGTSTICFKGRV